MSRLLWPLVLLGACGTTTDDRPLTVQYITEAILAPSCGAAQCHSTFAGNRFDIFDTVIGSRSSIVDNGLIVLDSQQYDPNTPQNAVLIQWLTQTDPQGLGIGRMPYDAPMPNEDVRLLEKWIQGGAKGAQCDPNLNNGMACNNTTLMKCGPDWNFSTVVQACPTSCSGGVCQ